MLIRGPFSTPSSAGFLSCPFLDLVRILGKVAGVRLRGGRRRSVRLPYAPWWLVQRTTCICGMLLREGFRVTGYLLRSYCPHPTTAVIGVHGAR